MFWFLMLPTQKCFASKVPTENRNCLSLPTRVCFFEKVPTDERKRLGATQAKKESCVFCSGVLRMT